MSQSLATGDAVALFISLGVTKSIAYSDQEGRLALPETIGAAASTRSAQPVSRREIHQTSTIPFLYPTNTEIPVSAMEDDASFLGAMYTVHLNRSLGLGHGTMGYGMQFEPRQAGPTVTKVFQGGEAFRTGLIQVGDVLIEVNGQPIKGRAFMEVMDSVVATKSCSFTFASGPVR